MHVAGNFLFTSQFHSPQKVELLQSFDGETIDVAVYFIYINIYACVYMYIKPPDGCLSFVRKT